MRRIILVALGLVACGAQEGTVTVTAWGEGRATEGFTAAETDGWAVRFDHWYTVLADIELSDPQSGEVEASAAGPFLIDWTEHDSPAQVVEIPVRAGRVDAGFSYAVAGQQADAIGAVTADDLAELEAGGFVHLIEGQATDGERTVGFRWGLKRPVRFELCVNGLDSTPGLAVPKDGSVDMQITLHVDHLLWDEIGGEEAALSFGPLADADADGDDFITTEELAARSTLEAGRETGGYDLPDLEAFLALSAAQTGHLNGGGLCQARARQGG